ncbi:hypothetical protein LZ32DRAFT_599195 [Colletotrichum eremochloae]|nr:hypothetical protein LZ32DRAFT_599195 [Colletotrichum eremochloae]
MVGARSPGALEPWSPGNAPGPPAHPLPHVLFRSVPAPVDPEKEAGVVLRSSFPSSH